MLGKPDLKDSDLPWLAAVGIGKPIGLSISEVERVTLIATSPDANDMVLIVKSARPLPEKAILDVYVPDPEKVHHDGKTVIVNKGSNRAICFLNQSLLVYGVKDGVMQLLKQLDGIETDPPPCRKALAQAGKHDVVFWGGSKLMSDTEVLKKLDIESALGMLDVGKQVDFQLLLGCASKTKTLDLAKSVRAVIKILQGQLLMACAMKDADKLLKDEALPKDLPWKLIAQAEKGLQRSVVRAEKTNVSVSVAIPIAVKTLRSETEQMIKQYNRVGSGTGISLTLPFAERMVVREISPTDTFLGPARAAVPEGIPSTLQPRPSTAVLPAPAEPFPADIVRVPADCTAFVTVQFTRLLGKLGIKEEDNAPLLAKARERLGIALVDIERLTWVRPSSAKDDLWIFILQGTKPLPWKDIQTAYLPGAEEVQFNGKVIHALPGNDSAPALYLDGPRLLIGGTKESLKQFLKRPRGKSEMTKSLMEALGEAQCHDIAGWTRVEQLMDTELTRIGLETALGTLDIGKQIDAGLRLTCSDEGKVGDVVKGVRGYISMARSQLLVGNGLKEVGPLMAAAKGEELPGLPWELMAQTEKALQNAVFRSEGKAVTVSLAIAANAKTVRSEIDSLVKLQTKKNGDSSSLTLPFPFCERIEVVKNTPPQPSVVVPPPQGRPYDPSILPPDGRFGPQTPQPVITSPSWQGASGPMIQPVSAPAQVPSPFLQPNQLAEVKLTVANVRKEEALIFEMEAGNKLTFVQKVPAGSAVDVKTTTNKQLVAIFADKPAGQWYSVWPAPQPDAVWLLR